MTVPSILNRHIKPQTLLFCRLINGPFLHSHQAYWPHDFQCVRWDWAGIVFHWNGEKFLQLSHCLHKWKKSWSFSLPFTLKSRLFSCILTKLPHYVTATMTTLKHPVGATQLEISRIVLDIFRFHQSKWLRFSIKMLNLGAGLRELGRKCDAVSIDDKWPSFDWTNREIRDQNSPRLFFFKERLHGDLRLCPLGHTLHKICSDKMIAFRLWQ